MLPRSDGTASAPSRKRGGMDWMEPLKDLNTTPKSAKILAVKADPDNRFGARVVLKLALDGAVKFWGVNVTKNPNYHILEQKFGLEENDWAGQSILLSLTKDEFSEQYNPLITFPETKATRR